MMIAILITAVLISSPGPAPQSDEGAGDEFSLWLADLRADALEAGISAATVESALGDVRPIERVVELDRNQPETRLDFWTYLNRIASDSRIERGRQVLEQNRDLLAGIEDRHGIPASMMVAIWAVESSFGTNQGGFPVVQALVTLAHDPRRSSMFRSEVLHALRILDEGHIDLAGMQGSWAGAMGQVQFMPSTFLDFARDADGDGRRDIWKSDADALESAAAYMSTGWRRGYIWGRQVRLPDGFDQSQAGLGTTKPLAEWQALGVRRADGSDLPTADIGGSIVLPGDGSQPAFLVYQNYRALLRWNRSNLFAISVAHLADRIAGLPPLRR